MGSILIDESALERVRQFPCDICGSTDMVKAAHHIVRRGAGAGRRYDAVENLLCVCMFAQFDWNTGKVRNCHVDADSLPRRQQFKLVAQREGLDWRTVERRVLKAIRVRK